jgi:predicted TIM-barrel fold metal-dependent hydrolase
MDVNGIAASLNFPSFAGIDGGLFLGVPDKQQALVHLRAYNDWHIDEWCGAYPGRFIPCGVLPLWDMQETAAEIHRLAKKGCHAVTFNDNPTQRAQRLLGTHVESRHRHRHGNLPAHRLRQRRAACLE